MSKELNIFEMLDFSEKDLTAPNQVVEEILKQLPENTQKIIFGQISEYKGAALSNENETEDWMEALRTMTSKRHAEIQKNLGKQGEKNKVYECFLYTAGYAEYKYRMFFMEFGLANYPGEIYLEESIIRSITNSIQDDDLGCTIICNERKELEDLVMSVLTSKKVLEIMQELIRIYQAKRQDKQ